MQNTLQKTSKGSIFKRKNTTDEIFNTKFMNDKRPIISQIQSHRPSIEQSFTNNNLSSTISKNICNNELNSIDEIQNTVLNKCLPVNIKNGSKDSSRINEEESVNVLKETQFFKPIKLRNPNYDQKYNRSGSGLDFKPSSGSTENKVRFKLGESLTVFSLRGSKLRDNIDPTNTVSPKNTTHRHTNSSFKAPKISNSQESTNSPLINIKSPFVKKDKKFVKALQDQYTHIEETLTKHLTDHFRNCSDKQRVSYLDELKLRLNYLVGEKKADNMIKFVCNIEPQSITDNLRKKAIACLKKQYPRQTFPK